MRYKSSNKRIKSKKGINNVTSLLNLFESSKDRIANYKCTNIQKYKDVLYKGIWFNYKNQILIDLYKKQTFKELYNNFISLYKLDCDIYTYNSFYISVYRWGIYYSEHTAEYYTCIRQENKFSNINKYLCEDNYIITKQIIQIVKSSQFNEYISHIEKEIIKIKQDISYIENKKDLNNNLQNKSIYMNKLSRLYSRLDFLNKDLNNLYKFKDIIM